MLFLQLLFQSAIDMRCYIYQKSHVTRMETLETYQDGVHSSIRDISCYCFLFKQQVDKNIRSSLKQVPVTDELW